MLYKVYRTYIQCSCMCVMLRHSWAQRKLSPLNILLLINGRLLSSGLTDLTINGCILQKFNDQRFQRFQKM